MTVPDNKATLAYSQSTYMIDPEWDEDVGAHKVSKIAISRCERAVLKHICFWYPKAKTLRNGFVWLVRPADEFQAYGVDYQADTIRRAVRALAHRDILITERHFHPYRPVPGPVLWIRPGVPLIDDAKGLIKKKVQTFVTE